MINGLGTREAPSDVASPDALDAFATLRVRQSDRDDASAPSSRYSSCRESEFDRYCSENSVMGTPSMSGPITVFNDFTEYDFGSPKSFGIGGDNGLENFSLGGRVEMNHKAQMLSTSIVSDSMRDFRTGFGSENIGNRQNLRYGSSGLELYGDDNDELTMTILDESSLMGVNQLDKNLDQDFVHKDDVEGSEVCKGHNELGGAENYFDTTSSDEGDNAGNTETYLLSNVDEKGSQSILTVEEGSSSCAVGKENEFGSFDPQSNLQIDEREVEREEDGNSSSCEQSEGENSMYNYGGDDDLKNDFCLPRSIHHRQETKEQEENPLLINTSVAFGLEDLDDFLLENEGNDQVSQVFGLFHSQEENNPEVDKSPTTFGAVSSTGISIVGQNEGGKDRKDMVMFTEKVEEIKDLGEPKEAKMVRDRHATCCPIQEADKFTKTAESSSNASSDFPKIVTSCQEDVREIIVAKNNCPQACSITKDYKVDLGPLAEEASRHMGLSVTDGGAMEKGNEYAKTEEVIGASDVQHVENPALDKSKFKFDHFSDSKVEHEFSSLTKQLGNLNEESFRNLERVGVFSNYEMSKTLESSSTSTNLYEKSPLTSQIENFERNELYDEVVHEMEEILLDSVDSPAAWLAQGNRFLEPQFSMPSRDGGLTASTSGTDNAYLLVQHPMRIDRIEVVGARQKKGDVSFSERLVGVKEYTIYRIKVWSSKDQWEVERRYRDFLTLYRRVKALFTEQGWDLPLPWSSVEKESKKIFGSAFPDVIAQRSVLIQECLQSILHSRFFSSPPSALIWFLSPQDSYPSSPASNTLVSQSPLMRGTNNRSLSTLGKTISLIVEIPPNKSMKQMLEAQHNSCAGCHKNFDDGKTLIRDFVETFGWGKPRICEYTGQLFCSSCHTNETAVLPARVLHHWDFTQYPVSQLAKSYLDSIHDQPMLCVTAVNPFLLSKVPALLHVMSVRKKIRTVLPYVRCPFRRSINRGLGARRYLLDSNDFFALRDLIDLSKGAFAALPIVVETLSSKILEHITDQCLICCDVGIPCSARQDCSDPSSLIFPFQEDEIERCKSCQSVFHKCCFRKLRNCPCGAHLRLDETMSLTNRRSQRGSSETRGTLDLLGRSLGSGLSSRFLSGLFTKEEHQKTREHKDENIILMGSLPSTSL